MIGGFGVVLVGFFLFFFALVITVLFRMGEYLIFVTIRILELMVHSVCIFKILPDIAKLLSKKA